MIRILFLVISSDSLPWAKLRELQESTWAKFLAPEDSIRFIYGTRNLAAVSDDPTDYHDLYISDTEKRFFQPLSSNFHSVQSTTWRFSSRNGYEELLSNTLHALKQAINCIDFDFVVRTNNSTFWDVEKLRNSLSGFQEDKLYAGNIWKHQGLEYVGGYGIILNRKTAELLVQNSDKAVLNFADDLAIGSLLRELGVRPTTLPIAWLHRPREIPLVFTKKFLNPAGVRCKVDFSFPSRRAIRILRDFGVDIGRIQFIARLDYIPMYLLFIWKKYLN